MACPPENDRAEIDAVLIEVIIAVELELPVELGIVLKVAVDEEMMRRPVILFEVDGASS
jgi:hypothetical protein